MGALMDTKYDLIPAPHQAAAVERVGGRLMIATADDKLHYFVDEADQVNEVGERICELADGSRTVRAIAQAICDEFEVEPDVALTDAADFLHHLVESKVLIWKAESGAGQKSAPSGP